MASIIYICDEIYAVLPTLTGGKMQKSTEKISMSQQKIDAIMRTKSRGKTEVDKLTRIGTNGGGHKDQKHIGTSAALVKKITNCWIYSEFT